jgi:plasmid stabilization system protein ParE
MRYTLTAVARRDVEEVYRWYRDIEAPLGYEFLAELRDTIHMIMQRRNLFPEVEPRVRRAICPNFPYKIFYSIRTDEIRILSVYHHSRDPRRWKKH